MIKRRHIWVIPLVLALVIATGCANVSGQLPEQSASNHLNAREELEILKQLWGRDITEAEYIQKVDPAALRRMPEEEIRHAEVTKVDWSAIAECAIATDFGKAPEGQLLTSIANEEQIERIRQLWDQDISLGELFEQVFPEILEQMPEDQVERLYDNRMCWHGFESPDLEHNYLKSIKVTVDIGPWHIAEPEYDTFTRMMAMKLKMLPWSLELNSREQLKVINELLSKDISIAELLKRVYPEALEDMPKDMLDCLYLVKVDWPPRPSTPPPSQPLSEPSTSSQQSCAKSVVITGFEGGPSITFDLCWAKRV